jgi:hypothetical protein
VTAAAAAVIGLTAGPVLARSTWTVTPGGSVSAKAATTVLTDTTTGTALTCTSSTAIGTFKSGGGLPGTSIATLRSWTLNGCTVFGETFTIKVSAGLRVNAVKYNTTTGVSTLKITRLHVALSGPACSAVADGTSAARHTGTVKATYANSAGTLKILSTGGRLRVFSVHGCAGLIFNGDSVSVTNSAAVSPPQTITGP